MWKIVKASKALVLYIYILMSSQKKITLIDLNDTTLIFFNAFHFYVQVP